MLTEAQKAALDAGRQKAHERLRRRHWMYREIIRGLVEYGPYGSYAALGRGDAVQIAKQLRLPDRTVRRYLSELMREAA